MHKFILNFGAVFRPKLISWGLLCWVLLTASCNHSPVATSTTVETKTKQPFATTQNVPTVTKTAGVTPSPTNTIPKTATPYPIASLTEEQILRLTDYATGSVGCTLPCWNGITPGISRVGELQGFFARLGVDIQGLERTESIDGDWMIGSYLSTYPPGKTERQPGTGVDVINDTVVEIWLSVLDHPQAYDVSRIDAALGLPEAIYINLGIGAPGNFQCVFDYPARNTIIRLNAPSGTKIRSISETESVAEFCIGDETLKDVEVEIYSNEISERVRSRYLDFPYYIWNEELGISRDDLFEMLQDPSGCVKIP